MPTPQHPPPPQAYSSRFALCSISFALVSCLASTEPLFSQPWLIDWNSPCDAALHFLHGFLLVYGFVRLVHIPCHCSQHLAPIPHPLCIRMHTKTTLGVGCQSPLDESPSYWCRPQAPCTSCSRLFSDESRSYRTWPCTGRQ